MKAAVWQGPGRGHAIERVPDPTPGPGEVVLRVERSGICGSDLSLTQEREGPTLFGPDFEAAFAAGAVLGHEFLGTVAEIGAGVEGVSEGDRLAPMFFHGCGSCVSCLSGVPQECAEVSWFMGGYAQFARAKPGFSVQVPDGLSPDAGALVEPLATSLRIAIAAGIEPGSKVLVLGAGALGLGVVHFARRHGAGQIVAVARTDAKADAAHRMGADRLVASPQSMPLDELKGLFGSLPDVVVETAGAPGLVDDAIMYARPRGTVVVAGLCLSPEPTSHAVASLKNLTLRYSSAYTLGDFEHVADLLSRGSAPEIDLSTEIVGLGRFPDAFEGLRAGGAAHKVLLDPWSDAGE